MAVSAEEADGEKKEKATPEAVAIAGTLLGAVLFQIALLYLTNHPDDDMRKNHRDLHISASMPVEQQKRGSGHMCPRRYSYHIINATISIFSAVLFFQTINEVVREFLLEGQSAETVLLVNMGHMLFWFLVLQTSLAWISGAICSAPKSMEAMELNMKSVAQLLAHVTGFASINAWGSLQQHPAFNATPLKSLAVIPISFCFLVALQRITNGVRHRVSLADDDIEDEMEKMWDEQTEESEIDIIGLTMSFNACQAIRFSIIGCLPTSDGREPPDVMFNHQPYEIGMLAATGLGFASLMLLMHLRMRRGNSGSAASMIDGRGKASGTKRSARSLRQLRPALMCSFSMVFAWCTFFSARMFLVGVPGLEDPMISSVVLTLCISFASFGCISALDWLADASVHGTRVPALKSLIDAFAILVGFGWEQCFDQAVESLSCSLPHPQLYKPALAMLSIVIILPAWRWYLLPMALREGWDFGFVFSSQKAHKKAKIARHILTHMQSQGLDLEQELDKIASELGYVKRQMLSQAMPEVLQSQPSASAFAAAAPASPAAYSSPGAALLVGEESGLPRPCAMDLDGTHRFANRVQELEGLTQSLLGSLHRGKRHEDHT